MEVLLIRKPYEVAFSGNPMQYEFGLHPYGEKEAALSYSLIVTILVEQIFGTEFYEEVKSQQFMPDSDGIVKLDVRTILDAHLEYFVPLMKQNYICKATGQYKRYKLSAQILKQNVPAGSKLITDPQVVLKGGMSYDGFDPVRFFTDFIATQGFLNIPTQQRTRIENPMFIYLLVPPTMDNSRIYFDYNVHDQQGVSIVYDQFPECKRWEIIVIPCGYNQRLMGVINTTPFKWTVTAYGNGWNSGDFTFTPDFRQLYDAPTLIYRSSLGGLETITLRGQVETETEYFRDQAVNVTDFFGIPMPRQTLDIHAEEVENGKGETGFISKDEILKMRDFMLSRQKWEYVDGRLIPISINQKNAKLFTNKDSLFSLSVEWVRAYRNEYYTPGYLYQQLPQSCPSPERLEVRQLNKTSVAVFYSLPHPYDTARVRVTTTSSGNYYDFILRGSSKKISLPVYFPNAPNYPENIQVDVQTVIDSLVYLDSRAVSTNLQLDNSLPVAGIKVFQTPGGNSTALEMKGNLLDECYDPDGDDINIVSVNRYGINGGLFDIHRNGKVFYTPPSTNFKGVDYTVYNVEETATNIVSPDGQVYIFVGGVAIFAKVVYTDLRNVILKDGNNFDLFRTIAKASIEFYSNKEATLKLDITGLNLDIEWAITETGFSNGGPTGPNITRTITNVNAGTKLQVYDGILNEYALNQGSLQYSSNFLIEVTPGTGYLVL